MRMKLYASAYTEVRCMAALSNHLSNSGSMHDEMTRVSDQRAGSAEICHLKTLRMPHTRLLKVNCGVFILQLNTDARIASMVTERETDQKWLPNNEPIQARKGKKEKIKKKVKSVRAYS